MFSVSINFMAKQREQLLHDILEKIIKLLKNTHMGTFPFKDYNISRPQAGLLFHLIKTKEDGVSMKELAEHLCVTSGAITQLIDDLVEKKLLVREHDVNDRRTVKVKLTPESLAHFHVFKQKYFKAISPSFDNLTDEELKTLQKLTEKIKLA